MANPEEKTFHCELIDPKGKLLDQEVAAVVLPAHDGHLGILYNHMPMLCQLGLGMRVTTASAVASPAGPEPSKARQAVGGARALRWFERTGRDATFEYVLLDGINDKDEHADALARLAGRHLNVNLIPMNPVSFAKDLKAPPPERTERFAGILRKAGVVVHVRRQRGDDVAAACGQLRLSRVS